MFAPHYLAPALQDRSLRFSHRIAQWPWCKGQLAVYNRKLFVGTSKPFEKGDEFIVRRFQGLVRFSVNGARAILSSPVSPSIIVLLSRSDIKISFLFRDWARNASQLPVITASSLSIALLQVLKAFRPICPDRVATSI